MVGRGRSVAVCDRHLNDARAANIAGLVSPTGLRAEDASTWLGDHRAEVEAVIHMGAISATTEMDVDLDAEDQRLVHRWSCGTWCATAGIPFLYASSAQVYGSGSQGFVDDEAPGAMARLRTITPYGASKLLFDRLAVRDRDGGRTCPPQWAGLRFFNVYGPHETHKGDMRSVIAKTYPALAAGEPISLFRSDRPEYEDGGQMRDFIHVRDCVDVALWLLDHPEVSGIFNLGTGQASSWADLAHAMFAALGREPEIEYIDMPEKLRGRYQHFTQADMTKLRKRRLRPAVHEPGRWRRGLHPVICGGGRRSR